VVDAPLNVPELSDELPTHRRPALGYALVLAAIVLWSINATVAKIVVDSGGLTPLRLAEVRGTGAAILLFAGVAIFAPCTLRATRRELGYLAIFGICGLAFVHFFYFTAITHLDIGIALVIQYLAPVLVALWARFFVHEPVRRRLWYALALALGQIVSGAVLVEVIFGYPGIGTVLFQAIRENDHFLIQGIVFTVIVALGLATLILDAVYPLLDPRISYRKA